MYKGKSFISASPDEVSISKISLLITGSVKSFTVTTVAGNLGIGFFYNGQGTNARFNFPQGIDLLEMETFILLMILVELYVK